jgi:hypothetical protein
VESVEDETENIPCVDDISERKRDRTTEYLLKTLEENGFENIALGHLRDCPQSVLSVIWKLLSDKVTDVRILNDERERLARVLNDNKQLKLSKSKLEHSVERLHQQMRNIELSFQRQESDLKSRIADLERNRTEWEKCAVAYKSRESRFVAEIRKRDTEFELYQSKVGGRSTQRRGLSLNRY